MDEPDLDAKLGAADRIVSPSDGIHHSITPIDRPTGFLARDERSSSESSCEASPARAVTPAVLRSRSATKMQNAIRRMQAKRAFDRCRRAALFVQKLLRGWMQRRRVRRWRSAARMALIHDRAQKAELRPTPLSIPHATTPGATRCSSRQRTPRLLTPHSIHAQSKSQQFTLRLQDAADVSAQHPTSPSHFDLVVGGTNVTLHDALYESGKRHFKAGHLERALVDFELVRQQLERLESRTAKREQRQSRFDPASTNFRNLDDYIDKLTCAIARRKQRAAATVLDQRALLAADRGDLSRPSCLTRVQAGCLRCLTALGEVSEVAGRIRRDLVPPESKDDKKEACNGDAK